MSMSPLGSLLPSTADLSDRNGRADMQPSLSENAADMIWSLRRSVDAARHGAELGSAGERYPWLRSR